MTEKKREVSGHVSVNLRPKVVKALDRYATMLHTNRASILRTIIEKGVIVFDRHLKKNGGGLEWSQLL